MPAVHDAKNWLLALPPPHVRCDFRAASLLKAERTRSGLTRAALAQKAGVSVSTVWLAECAVGDKRIYETLFSALGVPPPMVQPRARWISLAMLPIMLPSVAVGTALAGPGRKCVAALLYVILIICFFEWLWLSNDSSDVRLGKTIESMFLVSQALVISALLHVAAGFLLKRGTMKEPGSQAVGLMASAWLLAAIGFLPTLHVVHALHGEEARITTQMKAWMAQSKEIAAQRDSPEKAEALRVVSLAMMTDAFGVSSKASLSAEATERLHEINAACELTHAADACAERDGLMQFVRTAPALSKAHLLGVIAGLWPIRG